MLTRETKLIHMDANSFCDKTVKMFVREKYKTAEIIAKAEYAQKTLAQFI